MFMAFSASQVSFHWSFEKGDACQHELYAGIW